MTDYEDFERVMDEPLTSGPSSPVRNVRGRPDRPNSAALKEIADGGRLANVFCRRRGRQLIAVLTGPRTMFVVTTSALSGEVRGFTDIIATCRCGWDHVIVGDLLVRAVSELNLARRGVPALWVDTLERLPADDGNVK